MNILLTCAGRRNYLIQYFRDAVSGRGLICAADANGSAPALQEADRAFVVPPVGDPGYVQALLHICRSEQVGLLVPLNDHELPVLAAARERFLELGSTPVVSTPDIVETCFDKLATCTFAKGAGVRTPVTCLSPDEAKAAIARGEMRYPLVLKPRRGSASLGIEYVEDEVELDAAWQLQCLRARRGGVEGGMLVQERLEGEEYGLDVVNDLEGNHVCTFARHKLGMRAGETDRAIIVKDEGLRDIGAAIGRSLGHVGNLDCDVFRASGEYHLLEMNPRFGGGYPFSHEAGANLPAALIAWASGDAVMDEWLRVKPGASFGKCDRLVGIRVQ